MRHLLPAAAPYVDVVCKKIYKKFLNQAIYGYTIFITSNHVFLLGLTCATLHGDFFALVNVTLSKSKSKHFVVSVEVETGRSLLSFEQLFTIILTLSRELCTLSINILNKQADSYYILIFSIKFLLQFFIKLNFNLFFLSNIII